MIKYSIVIMGTKPGTPKSQIQETKAYGAAQVNEVLDFDAFCQHLADHNSPYSKGSIRGILTDAVACIREQMLAGNKVCLGDLGDFHVERRVTSSGTCVRMPLSNLCLTAGSRKMRLMSSGILKRFKVWSESPTVNDVNAPFGDGF